MHYGAMDGHKEVVEMLIDKYSLSATEKDNVSSCCIVHERSYHGVASFCFHCRTERRPWD